MRLQVDIARRRGITFELTYSSALRGVALLGVLAIVVLTSPCQMLRAGASLSAMRLPC